MTLETRSLPLLTEALGTLEEAFEDLPPFAPDVDLGALRSVLQEVATRMGDNFPYPHPLYAGQMLKPPHPVARLAYALSLWINPNNHALDGGRASSAMEREAVAHLARMLGWDTHLGHLTSGGTMANLEALWVGRRIRPQGAVLASEHAHYTHERISGVLGMPFRAVAADASGRLDVAALERELEKGDVGTLVVTLGATATGAVDPLGDVVATARRHGVRIHVDAAYGGYFALVGNLDAEARRAFDALPEADSIVVDPHKHGLQPYGCGCVLFRDPEVGAFYRHDSPYTYFSSEDLHLGEISLECSRAGASAVALWATQRLLPCEPDGDFARDLESCREAALALHAQLENDARFLPILRPELDIVVWLVRSRTAAEASRQARRVFEAAAARGVHLALAAFPRSLVEPASPDLDWGDEETVTCLRSCLMKPEHEDWLGELTARIDAAMEEVLSDT